jgi:hypothetical protein
MSNLEKSSKYSRKKSMAVEEVASKMIDQNKKSDYFTVLQNDIIQIDEVPNGSKTSSVTSSNGSRKKRRPRPQPATERPDDVIDISQLP